MSIRIFLYSILLLFGQTVLAYDFKPMVKDHMVPAYQSLAQATVALREAADSYCDAYPDGDIKNLQNRFSDAFLAWQSAQHLRLDPIKYFEREYRFQFWPDKRGSTGKHLRALLANPILDTEAPIDISKQSVAVQGFGALERLLFDDLSPDQKRCRIIKAITHNLQTMAAGVLHDVTAGDARYDLILINPGPNNLIYESDTILAGVLLNQLVTQLELIGRHKLARPLDESLEKARAKRTEAWRSQLSLPAIIRNLEACQALYHTTFATKLKKTQLHQHIEDQFDTAHQTAKGIKLPLSQAVTDPEQRLKLEQLQIQVLQLKNLFARELSQSLNLTVGFNSLDGD